MRQKITLAGLALTFACGSDDTVKDRLIGSWVVELSSVEGAAYTFNRDDTFELDVISAVGSEIQMEARVGTYELRDGATGLEDDDGDYLFCSVSASDSTCGTPWRAGYNVDFVGETLRLVTDQAIILLEPLRAVDDPASGIVTFGCFSDRGFSPSSACEPGGLKACIIAGQACEAIQVCNSDGSAYGPCVCP